MPQLLKPAHLEPMFHNKRRHRNEKHMHCNEEQPPLASTRRKPHTATKTQREQGLLFIAVCRLLIAVASLVAEHGL